MSRELLLRRTPIKSLGLAALVVAFAVSGFAEDPTTGLTVGTTSARAGADDPDLVEGSYRVDRGEHPALWVPPGEALEFEVQVDLGVFGEATVGTVTMSSGVEPYVSGLPRPGETLPEGGRMVAWVQTVARGGHLGYELDHSITTRFLPQDWPRILNSEVQTGSENRKRELKIGLTKGGWKSSYRGNSHCDGCKRLEHYVKASMPWNDDYHCKKCKRAEHRSWDKSRSRKAPAGAIDILGAVYLARTLVRDDEAKLELPMIQKDHLWTVHLEQGARQNISVPAGVFSCREVRLTVSQPPGEPTGSQRFSGLFGIKGALKIWLHESTGVPVLIEGDVPLGDIIDLHARVKLAKFRGTPVSFQAKK